MDKGGTMGFNGRTEGAFISESLKPDHVLFLPEPGQLTFGVIPCGLFGSGHGCLQGYLSLQKLHRLKVTERLEGLASGRKPFASMDRTSSTSPPENMRSTRSSILS